MRTRCVVLILVALFMFCAGCGGGGSTTGVAQDGPGPVAATTTISGVASKGIIKGGTVKIYATPASGDTGSKILLKTVTTDSSGRFSANLGSYAGIVLIEASGSYTDESTGNLQTIGENAPLRAVEVVSSAGQTMSVSVSPLTELATRKALSGAFLSEATIKSANTLVSNLFQFDVIATRPVEPATPAIGAATQPQRDYTIALAAVSRLAGSAGSVNAAIDTFYHDLSATNRLSQPTVAAFQDAAGAFLSDSAHNQTGITVIPKALTDTGRYTGVLTLKTVGAASAPITSIQMTLTLPNGVTVKRDASGELMVAVSGVAGKGAVGGKNLTAPDTLVLALISWPGFGVGEFATVTYVADPGTSPVESDFKATYQITGFDGTNDFSIPVSVVPALL